MDSSQNIATRLPQPTALSPQQASDPSRTSIAPAPTDASGLAAFASMLVGGTSPTPTPAELGELANQPGNLTNSGPGPAPGTPALAPPKQILSGADMSLQISALLMKMDDAQMGSEQQGIKVDDTQRQEAYKKANDQIDKIAKKLAAANKKKHALGILGVLGKVFGAIAAVALTVATGGAAAPLAAALIAYTVVDASMSVADSISTAVGGPHLALDTLMNKGIADIAKKCGASDKTAQKIGQWGSFAIQTTVAVLMLATSISGAVSMFRSANTVASLAKAGFTAAKVVAYSSQAANGATTVAQGGLTIAAGVDTEKEQDAEATKADADKTAALLGELIQQNMDQLRAIVDDLNTAMTNAADTLSSTAKTNTTVAQRAIV